VTRDELVNHILRAVFSVLDTNDAWRRAREDADSFRQAVRLAFEAQDRQLRSCLQPQDEGYRHACALADQLQHRLESVDSTSVIETIRRPVAEARGEPGVFLSLEQARALVALIDRRIGA
jgi:hypothetical protein